jgi:hypothetical protein
MILKELINKSIYGTIGYISSQDDINTLESYIVYNLPVLKEFKQIIVVTNYKNYPELVNDNTRLWKNYFPDCILVDLKVNRGHSFGIADSENAIIDYCKENNFKWLCKSANDVIFQESILDKEIDEADFYYMNGMGYEAMTHYNFDFNRIINECFYPQTNFYFIDISKIDYLYDKDYIDQTYNYIQSISNYSGKVWEYIDGWACELFLVKCVNRNNLTMFHLIPLEKYNFLLEIVKNNQIHDSSHKNMMIEGICHFQFPNQTVIEI